MTQSATSQTTSLSTNSTKPEAEFFEHLAAGKFMLQRSRSSGEFFFYPRIAEPRTGQRDLEWCEVSGLGTIYAVTIARARPPAPSKSVVLVDLDEGPRMMSSIPNMEADQVKIGMRVKARIAQHDGRPILYFDVQGEQSEVKQ